MISKQNAEHAISSAQEWERKGMYLKPVAGSLLERLTQSATLSETKAALQQDWQPDAGYISDLSAGFSTEENQVISQHDELQTQLAQEISGQIQQHFNFARNTVRPIVLQLVEQVRGALSSIPERVEFTPKLVLVDLPKPLVDPELQDSVQAYREVAVVSIHKSVGFEPADAKRIIEFAAPGSRSFDDEIASWLAGLGEDTILAYWDAIFGFGEHSSFSKLTSSPDSAAAAALFAFAICTTLVHNPPEGMELTRDQITLCGQIREQAALRLCYASDEEQTWTKNQRVLLTHTHTQVRVSGMVYREWIENGGSNAILFGSVLSPRPEAFIQQLNAKAGEYIAIWERHNKLLSAAHSAKRSGLFQEALYTSAMRTLGANLELAFAHLGTGEITPTHPGYITAIAAFKELCSSVREEEFVDLYKLARRIICTAVFPYSNALEILQGVDEAKENNPEATDSEAALVMLVQIVTKYIREQIEIGTLAAVA